MMSFRRCVIAVMLSLCGSGAIEPASVALGADPAPGGERRGGAQPRGAAVLRKQVRPLLIKHCYQCHSSEAKILKGGLHLDSRGGWMKGGDSGPAIVPGAPDKSLLIEAIRYQSLEMPPEGKLPDSEIVVLEKWVRMGAPDPRTDPASTRRPTGRSRRGPLALVVSTDRRSAGAASEERCLAALGRRSIHSRQT